MLQLASPEKGRLDLPWIPPASKPYAELLTCALPSFTPAPCRLHGR
jgi:hypothetical protein